LEGVNALTSARLAFFIAAWCASSFLFFSSSSSACSFLEDSLEEVERFEAAVTRVLCPFCLEDLDDLLRSPFVSFFFKLRGDMHLEIMELVKSPTTLPPGTLSRRPLFLERRQDYKMLLQGNCNSRNI